MPPFHHKPLGPTRQRGVISILTAALLMALLLVMVLVLDGGRLYLEKRQLQNIADMAALSAFALGTCNETTARRAAEKKENGFNSDKDSWEDINCDNGRFDATATRETPTSLILGGLFGEPTTLTATAASERGEPVAAFVVDSQLLSLSKNSLLDRVLTGVGLGIEDLVVLSSEGLANAKLTPANLLRGLTGLENLNLLTPEALISAGENLSIYKLLEEIGKASNSDITQQLSDLAIVLSTQSTKPLANIKLFGDGGVIRLPDNASDANNILGTEINISELLTLALFSSANTAAADLTLDIGLVSVDVRIIQPPTLAIGPVNTSASTTQISASLRLLGIPINLTVGGGMATLQEIRCSDSLSNNEKTSFKTTSSIIGGLGGLSSLLNGLVKPILESLLAILGLELGKTEVRVVSVSCGAPTLVQ